MFESIFNAASDSTIVAVTWQSVVATIGIAFLMGILVSLVYMATHKSGVYSQSFVLTLVMMPIIVALIIVLIGSNVARAFSLAGAFSIVRFKSNMGDPKDIAYIFFTMAIGLALGVGFMGYAVLFGVIFCALMYALDRLHYGKKRNMPKKLKITMPENMDYTGMFDDIFERYTTSSEMRQVKTTDLGSLLEAQYDVLMKKDVSEKNFIDELRCRNGNLTIILSMKAEEV